MIGQFLFFCKVMFDETMRYGSSPLIQALIRRFFWFPLAMLLLAQPGQVRRGPMQMHADHMPGWEGTCEIRAMAGDDFEAGCPVSVATAADA